MAESAYERTVLILDAEDGRLAPLSKSLDVLGYPPLYARGVSRIARIACERAAPVGALLLPAAYAGEWWPVVREKLVLPLAIAPCAVLPIGARLADADADALHAEGLRWALSEPFTPWELRFAVSMALSASDPDELRLETRVPCAIAVEAESPSRAIAAELTDLCTAGAFVAIPHPPPEGTPIALRAALCGQSVSLQARVVWRTGPDAPSWRDRGMGITFERMELAALGLVRQEVDRALGRFRIRMPASARTP